MPQARRAPRKATAATASARSADDGPAGGADLRSPLGQRLVLRRAQLSDASGPMSQTEAAVRCGVGARAWSRWESPDPEHQTFPHRAQLVKVAQGLGVSVAWLTAGDADDSEPVADAALEQRLAALEQQGALILAAVTAIRTALTDPESVQRGAAGLIAQELGDQSSRGAGVLPSRRR